MSEIKPKKMVRRSVAIALGIICILLIAVIAYFSITGMSAQNSYNNLQNQNNQLQTWLDGNETLLNQTETWLDGNITYFNSQITNLQNQLRPFQGSILGFSDLTAEDNRTDPETPYLHISGTVHNFGSNATDLGLIDVEAYENNGSVAIETTTLLQNIINGQSSINVDLSFYYTGSALALWTITVREAIPI